MTVEFACLLVRVAEEVEDQDTAAGFQNAVCGLEGPLGCGCVVEGLAEKGEVD